MTAVQIATRHNVAGSSAKNRNLCEGGPVSRDQSARTVWIESQSLSEGGADSEPPSQGMRKALDRRLILGIVVVVLVLVGIAALVAANEPVAVNTSTTTARISIYSPADVIVASAVQTSPAGFVNETSKQGLSSSSDWAVLQAPDGSEANLTATVYSSANVSQSYFDRLVAGVKGLPGYSDISSNLASFEQYGTCYGYGEDVDGIAVVNGVCTKGNAFLQVHLVSSVSLSDLEADLTVLMSALYQSAT